MAQRRYRRTSPSPLELLETFCCLQVARVQSSLWRRYGRAVWVDPDGTVRDGVMAHLMPQDDYFDREKMLAECEIEIKR